MVLEYTPQEAVAGDPAALHRTATALRKLRTDVAERERDYFSGLRRSGDIWKGDAGDGYRRRMAREWRPLSVLATDILPVVARGCDHLGDVLAYAQGQMRRAVDAVRLTPLRAPGYLLYRVCYGGEPAPGHGQQSAYPGYWVRYGNMTIVGLHDTTAFQPIVDQAALAFKTAREARTAFVDRVGGVREELARLLYTVPTAAERAIDGRVARGEVGDYGLGLQRLYGRWKGIAPDPQGRVLLYRYGHPYQEGGVFYHDDAWAQYLKSDEQLKTQVRAMLTEHAKQALNEGVLQFDERRNVEIDGGYFTGRQTLHGPDATVGGFHIKGSSAVRPLDNGGYEVTLRATYTWNDVIDPNHAYTRDTVGSTVYPGKPYDVHIDWTDTTTFVFDRRRHVVGIKGYTGNQ